MSPNPEKGIKFITVNTDGKAQLLLSDLQSFTLSNMYVQKVIFGGQSWIAFLGFKLVDRNRDPSFCDEVSDGDFADPPQVVEFFLQRDVNKCLLSIEAASEMTFNDIAAKDENTLAIALQNGAVVIHKVHVPFQNPWESLPISSRFHSKQILYAQHTYSPLTQVVFSKEPRETDMPRVADTSYLNYFAVSRDTIHSGRERLTSQPSETGFTTKLTLESEIRHLKAYTLTGGQEVLVAALEGQMAFSETSIQIIGCNPFNILVTVDNVHVSSIDDFVVTSVIDKKHDQFNRSQRHT